MGGAIFNHLGTVVLDNCQFSDGNLSVDLARTLGGAAFNLNGSLTATHTTFGAADSSAVIEGSAVYSLHLPDSRIVGRNQPAIVHIDASILDGAAPLTLDCQGVNGRGQPRASSSSPDRFSSSPDSLE